VKQVGLDASNLEKIMSDRQAARTVMKSAFAEGAS
jgi:hypothetical protein